MRRIPCRNYPCFGNVITVSRKQKGQSFVELLVILLILLPLFLMLPLIGKYQDISHSTSIASRYALFAAETRGRTLNTPARRQFLIDNIRRRIFSTADAPVKSNDVARNIEEERNGFWKDPQNRPLIDNFANITISFGESPTKHRDFKDSVDEQPFLLHNAFDLAARGIYTTTIHVQLATLPKNLDIYAPFNQLDLSIHRSASALLNSWTAWSPTNIENHMDHQSIFPSQRLSAFNSTLDAAVNTIERPGKSTGSAISAPKLGQLKFWRDSIPKDRLQKQPPATSISSPISFSEEEEE